MFDFSYKTVGEHNDITVLSLKGHLNSESCDYLFGCIESQIEEGCTKFIVDCNDLAHISSMGLGTLIRAHSRMQKVGGEVKLCNLHGTVAEVFKIVGLNEVFQIYPDRDAAVEAFG